jgi:hypothetical protein
LIIAINSWYNKSGGNEINMNKKLIFLEIEITSGGKRI